MVAKVPKIEGLVRQPKLISKAEFDKMSPKQRRLLVAKDVLASLRLERIVATRGTYFSTNHGDECRAKELLHLDIGPSCDARRALSALRQCHVCARGAVVIAAIERFDERIAWVDGSGNLFSSIWVMASDENEIEDIFPAEIMSDMEDIFESWELRLADLPGEKPEAKDTLMLIMKHIVAHGGNFSRTGFCREMNARAKSMAKKVARKESRT